MYELQKKILKGWRYIKSYLTISKKIGFYGAFGYGNIGDDASYFALKDFMKMDIRPLSKKLYAFNPLVLKAMLVGGGGIFHWNAPYFPRRILMKDKWDFPIIILSAGINCDYLCKYTSEAIKKIRRLCNISTLITVRDSLTRDFLLNLGVKKKIRILPDLALILREKKVNLPFKKDSFTVGISLAAHTEFTKRKNKELVFLITKIVNYLISKGHQILFLPFQICEYDKIDERKIFWQLIQNVEDKEKLYILDRYYSPPEMLYIIKNYCDFILGMRLHSNIFAANSDTPFISLSYNIKHKAFLKMMDLSMLDIPITSPSLLKEFRAKFEEIIKNYDSIKSKITVQKEFLQEVIKKEIQYIFNNFLT